MNTFKLTQTGPETQEILDEVNVLREDVDTNTEDIEQLQELYQAFINGGVVIIRPTDTWPVTNPESKVIYRVIDRENTPPEYYADYMWNGTSFSKMAQYDNNIDDEPTADSDNLVKSGGVLDYVATNGSAFDISVANAVGGVPAEYADLADALGTNGANVSSAVRKGGMSVKFIQQTPASYSVVVTEDVAEAPSGGVLLDSDPDLASGTYTASDLTELSSESALPTSVGGTKTYYFAVTGDTTTYTTLVVTLVQNFDNKYVQWRLMSKNWSGVVGNWEQIVEAVKLQGVTAKETKDTSADNNGYTVGVTGKLIAVSSAAYRKIDIEGVNKVRVLGLIQESGNNGSVGFAFYDSIAAPTVTENTGFISSIPYEIGTSPTKSLKDYILDVPVGAKYLYVMSKYTNANIPTFNDDFYCYLQTGYPAASTFRTGEFIGNFGIDDEPTVASENLVESGGVSVAIQQNRIVRNYTQAKSILLTTDDTRLKLIFEASNMDIITLYSSYSVGIFAGIYDTYEKAVQTTGVLQRLTTGSGFTRVPVLNAKSNHNGYMVIVFKNSAGTAITNEQKEEMLGSINISMGPFYEKTPFYIESLYILPNGTLGSSSNVESVFIINDDIQNVKVKASGASGEFNVISFYSSITPDSSNFISGVIRQTGVLKDYEASVPDNCKSIIISNHRATSEIFPYIFVKKEGMTREIYDAEQHIEEIQNQIYLPTLTENDAYLVENAYIRFSDKEKIATDRGRLYYFKSNDYTKVKVKSSFNDSLATVIAFFSTDYYSAESCIDAVHSRQGTLLDYEASVPDNCKLIIIGNGYAYNQSCPIEISAESIRTDIDKLSEKVDELAGTYEQAEISGDMIVIKPRFFGRQSIMELNGFPSVQQGMAIYSKYLVTTHHDHTDRVYLFNIETNELITTFSSLSNGHANAMCFTNEYYDSDSILPLLYISCWNPRTLMVYDIRYANNEYSINLIQTITPNTSSSVFGGGPNEWVVDYDNDILYSFCCKDGSNGVSDHCLVTSFNLPSSSISAVSLVDADVIDNYDIGPIYAIQDLCYNNGHVYLMQGAYAPYDVKCGMLNIDLSQKVKCGYLTFKDFTPNIPEGVDVYDCNLVVSFHESSKLFKLVL